MAAILALLLVLFAHPATMPDAGPGDRPRSDVAGAPLPDGPPYPGGFFGRAETTVVSVENFRFCVRGCGADSVAYVRTPAGPVPWSDNPRAAVYMPPGAAITWTYRDRACDLLRCAGHDIRIEDGSGDGRPIGEVSAGAGHDSLGWAIPEDAEPESIIRYFCARHAAMGMTGAFQVLPIRVLTVSYPPSPSEARKPGR